MNKRQKEILQSQLNSEQRTINELKQVYTQALKDCENKIMELSSRRDMENLQSIIYQKRYQQALKGQIEGVLEQLHSNSYSTVSDYLAMCYEDGYIGTMYDLQGQGIPMVMPIDQEQVVKALETDSKLSKPLYERMGEDINKLKRSVRAEISRGIATGMTWNDVAAKMAKTFKNTEFSRAFNRSMTIARTEGHRIQIQAADHAQHKAKEKGADIVKQWDATLDARTRDSHARVDGEIREIDEKFSNGLMYPGDPSGSAAEVVNCRCALLQRAKWALDDTELQTLNERAEYYGLDKTKNFEEYKEKYLKASKSEKAFENVEQLQKYSEDLLKNHGVTVDMYDANAVIKEAKENVDNLDKLLSEYNSTLNTFIIQKGRVSNEGGATYWLTDKITGMRINPTQIRNISTVADTLGVGENKHLVTVTHEFAHTLSSSTRNIDSDFWKEINKIKRDYKKELGYIELGKSKYTKNEIFISNYAAKNADEFMAESFAQAMLSDNPSPYAIKVLEAVNKYFKKK